MENVDLTPELISKAKTAKSAEELIKIAEGEGVKLDEKDAASFFAKLNQSEKELTDDELAVYKRGRNTKVNSAPHHANIAQYHAATGLEALFGWLYLTGKTARIEELFTAITEE